MVTKGWRTCFRINSFFSWIRSYGWTFVITYTKKPWEIMLGDEWIQCVYDYEINNLISQYSEDPNDMPMTPIHVLWTYIFLQSHFYSDIWPNLTAVDSLGNWIMMRSLIVHTRHDRICQLRAVPLWRSQFSPNSSQQTPHNSPTKARYGCLL